MRSVSAPTILATIMSLIALLYGCDPASVALAAPTLRSVSPTDIPWRGGTRLTLSGGNFSRSVRVLIGGVDATSVRRVSSTQITVTAPQSAGSFGGTTVTVINSDLSRANLENGVHYYADNISLVLKSPIYGGVAPAQVASGDFDGDGHNDLATVGPFSTKLHLIYGKSDGSFVPIAPSRSPDIGGEGAGIAAADMDADGVSDLIIAIPGSGRIAVLNGNLSGYPSSPMFYDIPGSPIAVTGADFDGDSHIDVAVVCRDTGNVHVLRGSATGRLTPDLVLAAGRSPMAIASADVNGDNIKDIVVSNTDDHSVGLFRGVASGGFDGMRLIAVGRQPVGLAIGDLDHDGRDEIVVAATESKEIYSLTNDDRAGLRILSSFTTAKRPSAVAIGDLDADRKLDIVVSFFEDIYIEVYHGELAGRLSLLSSINVGLSPFGLLITNLTLDQRPDIAVAATRGGVMMVLDNQSE